ncbi:TPA: hypothetical protein R5R88_004220 [Salmonella enterica]|nr:hypothetical protein [Salmonella enterica]
MKNNEFNFLVEELDRAFEERVKDVATSGYISASTLEEYREDAEELIRYFINGVYVSNNGRLTNSEGDYINENNENVNYEGMRINSNGELIDDNGNVIEYKGSQQYKRRSLKKMVANYSQFTMQDYIHYWIEKFNFVDLLKRQYDINKIDIDVYLRLSLICHRWGMYKSNLDQNDEQYEGRKYLFDALNYISLWIGGCKVLNINRMFEDNKRSLIEAAQLGGKGRAENYIPLKLKIVELLKEKVPKGGWKSKASAINALENDINKFMENEQQELESYRPGKKLKYYAAWDKMQRRISDWSRNDEMIKAAFNEVIMK